MVFVYVREAKEAGQHAMGPAVSDKGVWPVFLEKTLKLFSYHKALREKSINYKIKTRV